MPCDFEHDLLRFRVTVGYPPVGTEEEKDRVFHQALLSSPGIPKGLGQAYIASWVLARLSWLTKGRIAKEGYGRFSNDGGDFGYHFKVTNCSADLIGRFGVIIFPRSMTFAGFSNDGRDIKKLFIGLLTSQPESLRACEVTSIDPDDPKRREYRYGWNGSNFL